jgi:hypothetical protein
MVCLLIQNRSAGIKFQLNAKKTEKEVNYVRQETVEVSLKLHFTGEFIRVEECEETIC